MDACPNLNPFTKMPSSQIIQSEETIKPVDDQETKIFGSRVSPSSRRFILSRSLSLDRVSRVGLQRIGEQSTRDRDLRTVERFSRSRARVSENEVNRLRESRYRTIVQSRDARNAIDSAARFSRSRDLSTRVTDRRSSEHRSLKFERRLTDRTNRQSEDRRSRSVEGREMGEMTRRLNHDDRSMDRRNFLNLQSRTSNRRSLSTERRIPNEINRQESREVLSGRRNIRDLARRVDQRSEMRERVSRRSAELRDSNVIYERRAIEHKDADRFRHREERKNPLDRSAKMARWDTDRNNNRNRERSIETRRVLLDRVANQERRSRFSVATRNSHRDLIGFNDRRSLSQSTERLGVADPNRGMINREVRSVEPNIERFSDRRSSVRHTERREVDRVEYRRAESRVRDRKSLDRTASRVSSEDLHRGKIDSSRRITDRRNMANRDNSRATLAREIRLRYGLEEIAIRERNERLARSSRSINQDSMDRREFSRVADARNHDRRTRDSSERRGLILERRGKMSRSYRSSEERRVVLQKSRSLEKDSERQAPVRMLESRMSREIALERIHGGDSMRRATMDSVRRLDSRRSSERKVDESSRLRERSRTVDRHLERNLEQRFSRGRTLERRFATNLRGLSERRINEISRSREESRMQDRRLDRKNLEMQNSISMHMLERRANLRASVPQNRVLHSSERRSDERHDLQVRNSKERTVARSIDSRLTEYSERGSVRQLRQRSLRLNIKDPSKLASLRRVVRIARALEQNHEQWKLSTERTLSRIAENHLFAKWERNLLDARVDRNAEIRKIMPNSMKSNDFLKYSMTYDYIRQTLVIALCIIYGLSLYNGKKSFIR